jgi:hypothetical protein
VTHEHSYLLGTGCGFICDWNVLHLMWSERNNESIDTVMPTCLCVDFVLPKGLRITNSRTNSASIAAILRGRSQFWASAQETALYIQFSECLIQNYTKGSLTLEHIDIAMHMLCLDQRIPSRLRDLLMFVSKQMSDNVPQSERDKRANRRHVQNQLQLVYNMETS